MGFIETLSGNVLSEVEDSWENRLAEASYTPPSGIRITFDYEDVTRTVTKKTTQFSFPGVDGVLVQDFGLGERSYPIRAYFSGPDHDKQADVFEAALSEIGIGSLSTPLYGTHNSVPFGAWTRKDSLKTAANQSVIEVTFLKVLDELYPIGSEDLATATQVAVEEFGNASSAQFASNLSLASVSERQGVIDNIRDGLRKTQEGLNAVARVQQSALSEFEDTVAIVDNSLDLTISQPLTLANQVTSAVQAPAKSMAGISQRLDAYGNLAQDTPSIASPGGSGGNGFLLDRDGGAGNDMQGPNKFHVDNLYASGFITGLVLTSLYTAGNGAASTLLDVQEVAADGADISAKNKFETAAQALFAAGTILSRYDSYVDWRDSNFATISGDDSTFLSTPYTTDSSESHRALQRAVSLASSFLVELSFTLAKERILVLERPRSVLDLVGELYGGIDDQLDRFIDDNNLTGSEILELPRGRKIVYYV